MARSARFLLLLLPLVFGCQPARPNVLLITLDTTRVDHLSAYGYERETSPTLDALAEESQVFTRAYSTSSWTLPAHASLFTGKLPTSHGALHDPEGPLILSDAIPDAGVDEARARPLDTTSPTLAELFAEAGYLTGAVVAGPWLTASFGLDRGFAHYDDENAGSMAGRSAEEVTDRAAGWLREVGERPFFLFLNYFDPHAPLAYHEAMTDRFLTQLPPGARRRILTGQMTREDLLAFYDGEIRYMDDQIGRLFKHVRGRGYWDDSWIIVTADHGDLHGEHGVKGHGLFLHQEEILVPLLVKPPAGSGSRGRKDAPVSLIDVLPTLLGALGAELPGGVQGRPLDGDGGAVFAETYPLPSHSPEGAWRTLVVGDWKYLWSSQGRHQLFDVASDPGELRNRIGTEPERARAMAEQLERRFATLPAPGPAGGERRVDEETVRALEELGYVDSPRDTVK